MGKSEIESIVGEPVSGVAFVQDYAEIHFDGRILRALANPLVVREGVQYQFPAPGSRDALCALIGKVVDGLLIDEGSRIELRFHDGTALIVPLDDARRIGPEAAHFVPGSDRPIEVW